MPVVQFQTPAPAVPLLAVGDGARVGHAGNGVAEAGQQHMPAAALDGQPCPARLAVAGGEIIGLENSAPPAKLSRTLFS